MQGRRCRILALQQVTWRHVVDKTFVPLPSRPLPAAQIPRIVKGSWIVKQSVGTTPVLLGQKLATRYFRGPNYFEVHFPGGAGLA